MQQQYHVIASRTDPCGYGGSSATGLGSTTLGSTPRDTTPANNSQRLFSAAFLGTMHSSYPGRCLPGPFRYLFDLDRTSLSTGLGGIPVDACGILGFLLVVLLFGAASDEIACRWCGRDGDGSDLFAPGTTHSLEGSVADGSLETTVESVVPTTIKIATIRRIFIGTHRRVYLCFATFVVAAGESDRKFDIVVAIGLVPFHRYVDDDRNCHVWCHTDAILAFATFGGGFSDG